MCKLPFYSFIFFSLILSGCQKKIPKEDNFYLEKISFQQLPNWAQSDKREHIQAFLSSCDQFNQMPSHKPMTQTTTVKDWQVTCQALQKINSTNQNALNSFLEDWFSPYRIYDKGNTTGLFTGYYLPVLKGSTKPSKKFPYPVYGRPDDLVIVEDLGIFRPGEFYKGKRIAGKVHEGRLVPYYTRAAIKQGALNQKNLELFWVEDDIDLFFLQVQGSGIIELDNGKRVGVAYDGTNGHFYTSIGKLLIDQGIFNIDTISMPAIKEWLRNNPSQKAPLLNQNASYVFFKENTNTNAIGAQGVPLTPKVSLAVDTAYIPLGAPLWLDIEHPTLPDRIQSLAIAQDTGGAINGSVRGDLYWGEGDEAGHYAGKMRSTGQYYLLIPKSQKTRG